VGAPFYLAALDLRGRRCLVAGGGGVARRKALGLLAAGAEVLVVAPQVGDLPAGIAVERRAVQPADLDGAALAVCATGDALVNATLAAEARRRGVWVNVVDDPGAGDFTVPATRRRGALQVAVSTGGASPALAARLRAELEERFEPDYGALVALLGELRRAWEPAAIAAGVAPDSRRKAWQRVLDLPLLELLRVGDHAGARRRAQAVLDDALSSAG
jgi:siroheme synthase-like protein